MTTSHDWSAFVAGDGNIFFPALVSLVSLEEHNPDTFDRFMVFDATDLTPEMARLLDRYGIDFIDSKSVASSEEALALPTMHEGDWPVGVFLNWTLPEHLHGLGYRYSLKLDYDTLSLGPFPTTRYEETPFSASALPTEGPTDLSARAVRRVAQEAGLAAHHEQAYNVGVVPFDNARAVEFRLFERFQATYRILIEEDPEFPLLEQVCFAVLAVNMGDVVPLNARLNYRVKRTWKGKPRFTTDITILHFISTLKPWRPFLPRHVTNVSDRDRPMLPFYRHVWLDYASRIDGFETYCDERPYTALEVMCLANSIIDAERTKHDRRYERDMAAGSRARGPLSWAIALREYLTP